MRLKKLFWIALCTICAHAEEAEKFHVLSWSPRVFLMEDFLTVEECDHLIARARPHLQPSTIVAPDTWELQLDEGRTSLGTFFPKNSDDPIMRGIEKRIAEWTLLPEENGEPLQVLQYTQGGEYKPHYDYFNIANEGEAYYVNLGGQRMATVIMYLNEPNEGGETDFPYVGFAVKPAKGNALLFFNCTPDGEVDPLTLHAGVPVLRGEKWIATKWIRTQAWE